MDDKIYLRNEFPYSIELKNINSKLIDWHYDEVTGKGFYQKYTGHYGHIQLTISKSEDLYSHQLINNLNENQMPLAYINEVIKSLNFFIAYIQGIKGERVNLKFEITDGSFHIVDSRPKDFQIVTFYAIVDCFNKLRRQISEKDMEMINTCKKDLPN